jgi:hypothetical protein
MGLPSTATLLPQYEHSSATLLALGGGGTIFGNPPMSSPRLMPAAAPVHSYPPTMHPQTTLDMRIADQLWRVLEDGTAESRDALRLRPSF